MDAPNRVVSLVPSLTETLFDLGAGERVVGVTDWCGPALPHGARPTAVGGVQDPDLDALRQLRPDLVVACREENRRQDVEALTAAGIPVLVVHPTDPVTAAEAIRALGDALGLQRRARELADEVLAAVNHLAADPVPPTAAVVPIWRDPWITVGPGSYGHAVLGAAGFEVVGGVGDGPYPELDLRAARGAEVALLLDEPFDFHGAHGDELVALLAGTGGRGPRAVRVDGRWVAWYGSRSGRRLHRLARLRRTRP